MKRIIKKAMNAIGLDVHRNTAVRSQSRGWTVEYLSSLGDFLYVVDVGVGYGTGVLYEAFPQAEIILVEPLIEYKESIEEIKSRYSAQACFSALGSKKGEKTILVDTALPTRTSFFDRTKLTVTQSKLEERLVSVTTLDDVYVDFSLKDDVLLKIDTEGFELEVLKGGKQALKKTSVIVAEVSILERFNDSYHFSELIYFLEENGFRLFDIIKVAPRKNKPGAKYVDAVFVKNVV